MKAQIGSRGIDVLFLQPRCYMGVVGHLQAPAALPLRKRPGAHFTGGWAGPRAGLDTENLPSRTRRDVDQCFSTFVRPRPSKFFFHKTRARSQQIYLSVPFHFF